MIKHFNPKVFFVSIVMVICFFSLQTAFADEKLGFGDEKNLDNVISGLQENQTVLNQQVVANQQKEAEKSKLEENVAYLKEHCNAEYYKNYAFTPLEAGYNYVISNFTKGLFNLYQDPNAQKHGITLAYNLSLVESPAVVKLNKYFFERIKKEQVELVDTTVTGIQFLSEQDNVAEFKVDYELNVTRPTLISADDSRLSSIDPKVLKKSFKISLKNVSIIIKDLIKNDKILVEKKWFNNPFQLYVTDFELSDEKQ